MTDHTSRDNAANDVPEHINDRDGLVSMLLMGVAIALLLFLIIAIVQAM